MDTCLEARVNCTPWAKGLATLPNKAVFTTVPLNLLHVLSVRMSSIPLQLCNNASKLPQGNEHHQVRIRSVEILSSVSLLLLSVSCNSLK